MLQKLMSLCLSRRFPFAELLVANLGHGRRNQRF
jgi:hypothetical protein